jgi:hypothetical protein
VHRHSALGGAPQQPGVQKLLSVGTVCYGLYANPESGNQGSVFRDGVGEGWDLHLRPTDARAVTGPPDLWVELAERDYWAH